MSKNNGWDNKTERVEVLDKHLHWKWITSLVFLCFTSILVGRDEAWKERYLLAEKLQYELAIKDFKQLVDLLQDSHEDVSYRAALSLTHRAVEADSDLNVLLDAVARMDEARKWYGYKMLQNYPTKQTLVFLTDSLQKEIKLISEETAFDSRNSHYICESIGKILEAKEFSGRE